VQFFSDKFNVLIKAASIISIYIFMSLKIRKMIKNNFHYFRVREIIYILQTAYDAEKYLEKKDLFERD